MDTLSVFLTRTYSHGLILPLMTLYSRCTHGSRVELEKRRLELKSRMECLLQQGFEHLTSCFAVQKTNH